MEQEVKYVRIYVERLHKLYLESANEHLENHLEAMRIGKN